jgi:hypothetical protein
MGEVSGYLTMEGKEPITILDKAQWAHEHPLWGTDKEKSRSRKV